VIPRPYSVCRISFRPDSDAAIYTTIRSGYDSAEEAFEDIPAIAREEEIPEEELVVIQFMNRRDETNR
jgi:hypothetical protein